MADTTAQAEAARLAAEAAKKAASITAKMLAGLARHAAAQVKLGGGK
ncbi:MAG: hypothetical protein JO362_21815 [Streptomycetaceae bacterium]|nr:hypothetical protein [Streptomycetaceae bacterium]